MPAKTIVIVPPRMTQELFGAPDMIRMPTKSQPETTYDTHGRRFTIKRLSQSTYTLSNLLHDPRMRFGTAKEIAEDVSHTLETGRLPHAARNTIY